MRVDASSLAAEGFRYASASKQGGENEVVLGPSGGLTGFFESGPSGYAVDAQAQHLDVRRAAWRIGEGAVAVDRAARLQHAVLRLDIPAGDDPTRLRLGVESVEIPELRYAAKTLTLSASVLLEGALVERDATGKLTIVAVTALLRDVAIRVGEAEIAARLVRARRFALVSEGSSLRVSADSLEIEEVKVRAADLALHAGKLDAGSGIAWQDGRVTFGTLTVATVGVAYDFAATAPASAPEPQKGPAKRLPDLPALDLLSGKIAVDVHLTATLPLLKERGATHALRIPIDAGVVSFGELEDGFSAVADALLDFEVEGDELKLELDVIPIVKFDNVTLLSWKLVDPIDRELAAQKAIRLRRVLQFDRPQEDDKEPKAATKPKERSSVRLLGLDFAPILVELSARGPMELDLAGGKARFDDGQGTAIESLSVHGELHVAIEGDAKPGHLDATARGIVVGLEGMSFGSIGLARATVTLEAIEALHVDFDGARPTRATAKVPALRIDAASLRVGGEPG